MLRVEEEERECVVKNELRTKEGSIDVINAEKGS